MGKTQNNHQSHVREIKNLQKIIETPNPSRNPPLP
jgi:hypothetical protein